MMREFNIGDRVVVKDYTDLPAGDRNNGIARICGAVGTIKDKLFSEGVGDFLYVVHFDGHEKQSGKMWRSDLLMAYEETKAEYEFTFDIADNVVIAILTEDGEEIGRGHGHIIHEGSLGIVQAASYALKRIYERLNGGDGRWR